MGRRISFDYKHYFVYNLDVWWICAANINYNFAIRLEKIRGFFCLPS